MDGPAAAFVRRRSGRLEAFVRPPAASMGQAREVDPRGLRPTPSAPEPWGLFLWAPVRTEGRARSHNPLQRKILPQCPAGVMGPKKEAIHGGEQAWGGRKKGLVGWGGPIQKLLWKQGPVHSALKTGYMGVPRAPAPRE
ncbi:hypothetical protein NDU88_008127 [Pleurodeles waltl]|uniref:Uncharacterized protein n=1 Tax=Pleurodeles waltl TaxID=8319 RepID=A0AAV7U1H9_PLEWA|nr:hypothetical protein NDU88_008127 [Pleurodeles waltl]